jgi:Zn-dependent peptidase ImmA (M78 family)/DNA-binding XRE family transcriptional regulator
MSIGERIKIARTMAGLSQRDLADAGRVSAMAISKYERNHDTPGSAVLLRLAQALGVKVEYFFRPFEIQLSAPAYRRRQSLLDNQRDRIVARVQEWIERYVEIESLLDIELHADLPKPYPVHSFEDAEQAALKLREEWQIGVDPIEGLLALLEDRGIKVGLVDGPEEFDALTLWANESIPVIVVKRDLPGDRQRFCLAHELGHLVMDIDESIDEKTVEKLAHRFAAALLVPSSAVAAELGERRQTLSMYELHLLKHKYGLSMQAWIYRAKDTGVLPEAAAVRLFRQFSHNGWRKEEPGDQLEPEEPQRFKRLVVRGLAEDMISPARASELLGTPLPQFWHEEAERHGGLPLAIRD